MASIADAVQLFCFKELSLKLSSSFSYNIIHNILQDLFQRMQPVLEALQDLR